MTQRQSTVLLVPSSDPSSAVDVAPETDDVLQDWLGGLSWSDLELLVWCTARERGSGREIAYTIYDDDGDAAADPFTGVRIVAVYRDGASVVVAREEYDRIVADVCDVVIAHPPTPLPVWWDEFLANAAIVRSRTDR